MHYKALLFLLTFGLLQGIPAKPVDEEDTNGFAKSGEDFDAWLAEYDDDYVNAVTADESDGALGDEGNWAQDGDDTAQDIDNGLDKKWVE